MALLVPTACDAVPMDNPWAMGLCTWPTCNILKPSMAPNIPTTTTTAAVSEGMPPMLRDTSMAMGVVTDLGASDMATSWLAPHIRATITTETMPDMQPTSDDTTSGTICFLIVESCL